MSVILLRIARISLSMVFFNCAFVMVVIFNWLLIRPLEINREERIQLLKRLSILIAHGPAGSDRVQNILKGRGNIIGVRNYGAEKLNLLCVQHAFVNDDSYDIAQRRS